MQCRDYHLKHLLETQAYDDPNLFSDLGEDVFIPEPVKTYPLQSLNKIAEDVLSCLANLSSDEVFTNQSWQMIFRFASHGTLEQSKYKISGSSM